MKLKLSKLASIAEIIGAFAVVISLIYVGVQVNDSASAVRAASTNDANVALQSWYLLAEVGTIDAEFREAITAAIVGTKQLPGMRRNGGKDRATCIRGLPITLIS